MKKLLIIITCIATLSTAGCSGFRVPHRIDIQQGNVVSQEKVNRLETGMNRNQVQFIMGSPMIVDVFHEDRWDYIYYFKPGYGDVKEERVTLFFENDALVRIDGTMLPSATAEGDTGSPRQATLVVPPQERVDPGIFNRLWHWITFRSPGDEEF